MLRRPGSSGSRPRSPGPRRPWNASSARPPGRRAAPRRAAASSAARTAASSAASAVASVSDPACRVNSQQRAATPERQRAVGRSPLASLASHCAVRNVAADQLRRDEVAGEPQLDRPAGVDRHQVKAIRLQRPDTAGRQQRGDEVAAESSLASVCTTSIRSQPVTHGAVPSRRSRPRRRVARSSGGPGRAPPSAIPARRSPRHSGASHWSARPALAEAASARTAEWCCSQTKVVARQPLAMISITAQKVARSASRPPAAAARPARRGPAAASASKCAAGTLSAASTAIAAGNRTSSAICLARLSTCSAVMRSCCQSSKDRSHPVTRTASAPKLRPAN